MSDEAYQARILPQVSRTFALTIPQLPAGLHTAVANAYLLCRIADTIEDEPRIEPPESLRYLQRFTAVVRGEEAAGSLAVELAPKLSQWTSGAEHDLVANMERVVNITAALPARQRVALQRCVASMSHGMHQFQRTASLAGVPTMADMDSYCYYVAGVVGEMLTELFCSWSPDIERQRERMMALGLSFAQGLQMTNILKDQWEDRERGACWLPQDVFTRHGIELAHLTPQERGAGYEAALLELVGVAHAHLRNALCYTLLIPARERGIRRFCLWAIGLAVLTLKRIAANPGFNAGGEVKVSRRAVRMTLVSCNAACRFDGALRLLFKQVARGLPLTVLPDDWAPPRLPDDPHFGGA
jgi:farnesyl-diphosphate farnesyltransferase